MSNYIFETPKPACITGCRAFFSVLAALYIILCIKVALVTETGFGNGGFMVK